MIFKTTLLSMCLTATALAAPADQLPAFPMKVLPNAKIKSVTCEELSHINHDESISGMDIVTTEDGRDVEMRMVVSRFTNERAEAKALCRKLSDIKGGVKLNGLDPYLAG